MIERVVTDEDLRRVVEAERLANARANAEWRMRLAGHTATPRNRAILDILEETRGKHPTPRDIHERLRERHPAAILNSVYPVLHALEGAGLVRSRRIGRGSKRIDVRLEPHVDVLCGCGAIEEVEIDPSATAPTEETRKGVCQACSAGVPGKGAA